MNPITYKYKRFDPGIFMELYLPKKAEYQGILYDTLTKGFVIENVRKHLKANWDSILSLMAGRYTSQIKSLEQLDEIFSVFYGYSMYEVDGVFFDSPKIVEERTQVIRLMFRFDLKILADGNETSALTETQQRIARVLADDYLNYITDKPSFGDHHFEEYLKRWPEQEAFVKKATSLLEKWELSMVMFVLGYVIFEICEKIKSVHVATGRNPEEEIWITSFWNLRINRILKEDAQVSI